MIRLEIPDDTAAELCALGRLASDRGWVPATSGNFSARLDERTFLVTRSGVDKGALSANDFIAAPIEGPLPAGVSAEAPLHAARYRSDPTVGAVLHVHSIAATVLSRNAREIALEGFEMQKAFEGVSTHESVARVPIFANDQDTRRLADHVESRLAADAFAPAYLLAGHGVYVWGARIAQARRHLEGIIFLLDCALEERRLRP
jgi:methylthioribulose-1-phosphate dehydratase